MDKKKNGVYVHMHYYSAIRKYGIAGMWIDLEIITLNEISQT